MTGRNPAQGRQGIGGKAKKRSGADIAIGSWTSFFRPLSVTPSPRMRIGLDEKVFARNEARQGPLGIAEWKLPVIRVINIQNTFN